MNIPPFLLGLGLLIVSNVQAQTSSFKSSIGVGLERVGLDAPDGIGNRYLVGYARHWHNDRIVVTGNVGYLTALNRRYLVNDYYVDGKRRQRVTADLTAAFDFLNHTAHALRLGVGPSLWYRRDDLLASAAYTISADGSVSNVRVRWQEKEEVNYGFHVLVEYEYALTTRLLLRGNMKFASIKNAGPSTGYGLGLGYRIF